MGPGLGEPFKKCVANGIAPEGLGEFQCKNGQDGHLCRRDLAESGRGGQGTLRESMRIEGASVCQEWRKIPAQRTINLGRYVRARAQTPGVLGQSAASPGLVTLL